MTDLKDRFTSLLADEPASPDVLPTVLSDGRRARRRRTTVTAAAGTAGVAVVAAGIAAPLALQSGSPQRTVVVGPAAPASTPAPHPKPACDLANAHPGGTRKQAAERALLSIKHKIPSGSRIIDVKAVPSGGSARTFRICWTTEQRATPATAQPTGPAYHYSTSPQTIAANLADTLHARLVGLGFTPPDAAAFGQESSQLEKGHPSYFDGYVDVTHDGTIGDIGVAVTHRRTTQQPAPDECAPNPYGTSNVDCHSTTLTNGAVVQTSMLRLNKRAMLVEAVEERPDGVEVRAQETNYGFTAGPPAGSGPEPTTLARLVTLAEDPALTF